MPVSWRATSWDWQLTSAWALCALMQLQRLVWAVPLSSVKIRRKRDFMCETLQTAVLYTVWWNLSLILQAPSFLFFSATILFCNVRILRIWAHLFWWLFHPNSNVTLLPAENSGQSHAGSSIGAYYVNVQGANTAILFSSSLVFGPISCDVKQLQYVTEGCFKHCQSIVYWDKCTKHNPYVRRNCRQYTGWDYSVIENVYWSLYWQTSQLS